MNRTRHPKLLDLVAVLNPPPGADVEVGDVSTDGDLSVSSVSGHVRANRVKLRNLELSSISGDLVLRDITCDRLDAHSVSWLAVIW